MISEINDPSDEMLAISVTLRKMIRAWTEVAVKKVREWELAPCPEWFK